MNNIIGPQKFFFRPDSGAESNAGASKSNESDSIKSEPLKKKLHERERGTVISKEESQIINSIMQELKVAKITNKEAVRQLVDIVDEESIAMALKAIECLEQIGEDAIPALENIQLHRQNDVHYRAEGAQDSIIINKIQDSVDAFLEGRIDDKTAIEQVLSLDLFIHRCKENPGLNISIEQIRALGEIGTDDAIEFLSYIKPDADMREGKDYWESLLEAKAKALAMICTDSSIRALLEMRNIKDFPVDEIVDDALASIEKVTPDILEDLINSKRDYYSNGLQEYICGLNTEQVKNAVSFILSKPSNELSRIAVLFADVLRETNEAAAVQILNYMSSHTDEDVRCEVANTLGEIDTKAAKKILRVMKLDLDLDVANAAREALGENSPMEIKGLKDLLPILQNTEISDKPKYGIGSITFSIRSQNPALHDREICYYPLSKKVGIDLPVGQENQSFDFALELLPDNLQTIIKNAVKEKALNETIQFLNHASSQYSAVKQKDSLFAFTVRNQSQNIAGINELSLTHRGMQDKSLQLRIKYFAFDFELEIPTRSLTREALKKLSNSMWAAN